MILNLIDIYQYHYKNNSPKNSTHKLGFEVHMQFFKLYDGFYFVTNIIQMFKFFKKKFKN
jgi:hypothetical protein